jgi:carboxypeptidase T
MRTWFSLLFSTFLCLSLSAQTPTYQRLRIQLSESHTVEDLSYLGVDITHGVLAPQKYYENDFSLAEKQALVDAGFEVSVIIPDVANFYAEQMTLPNAARNGDCPTNEEAPFPYPTPENFELGSMGGYYTYEEMLATLDAMRDAYPHLITVKQPIPGYLTHQDSSIYWVRISDNPEVDETEPEVFYNALHHAREPGSLSQLIFFMWYLLENYGTDAEVTYLLNETELYFVPCINPDGYRYNHQNNPNGGGLWRKNRRLNDDGSFGVDLNRNYGFGWGYDNAGSSPNPESQVYRGPAPFSEPETQAIKAFCDSREFQIALNYHTFGNLLIYPWAYIDTPTGEAETFFAFAEAMTRDNNYLAGTATETVGYQVNGSSDDWMYGEDVTKPPIFAMTPEAGPGNFGFWPPSSFIEELCQSTLVHNLTTAHLVHRYGIAESTGSDIVTDFFGELDISIKRYGLQDGPLTISLTPLEGILSTSAPQEVDLDPYATSQLNFDYAVDPAAPFGSTLKWLISVDNGTVSLSDTLRKTFLGTPTVILSDNGQDLTQWEATADWGLTPLYFYSAATSLADSPLGDYPPGVDNSLISAPIPLETEADTVLLTFFARWEIETNFDYLQVSALDENGNFLAHLCGKYTVPGEGGFQPEGEPLYEGNQSTWVEEQMDLSDFIGQTIRLRFRMVSDGGVQQDGFYLDDLAITAYDPTLPSAINLPLDPPTNFLCFPNPASDHFYIDYPVMEDSPLIEVWDAQGRQVWSQKASLRPARLETTGWPSGLYMVQLRNEQGILGSERIQID